MKSFLSFAYLFISINLAFCQSNIIITNPTADAILKGNYNPDDYLPAQMIEDHRVIISEINNRVSPQLLRSYIETLTAFETRNTGSDTLSMTQGIGATRRAVHRFFEDISEENENRLQAFYLQFDQDICGMSQHRNICAILPGINVENHAVIIVEAHIDSRCETSCDTECSAHGAEDNASGSALVMELARVMSAYTFNNTIVFMCTIGEEQGLLGANAFAEYCRINDINVKAVFNNDIVGGVYCGETSSAPPCPFEGHIDSTQVRLFAQSGPSRQLARFNKYEYEEELKSIVDVPMLLSIMSQEDRSGRGGDHIPFRQKGYAAMRFTSANENGSANSGDPDYDGHQHTSDDILGVDTDGDNVLDSFFVDFNYLARNTVINGVSAAMAALGPETPGFDAEEDGNKLIVTIEDPMDYLNYRIFSRTSEEDFDTVYILEGSKTIEIDRSNNPNFLQQVSVASVDTAGIESLFSREQAYFPDLTSTQDISETIPYSNVVQVDQNRPNPFDEYTDLHFKVLNPTLIEELKLEIYDTYGRLVKTIHPQFTFGLNVIRLSRYDLGDSGIYYCAFKVNGLSTGVSKMVLLD